MHRSPPQERRPKEWPPRLQDSKLLNHKGHTRSAGAILLRFLRALCVSFLLGVLESWWQKSRETQRHHFLHFCHFPHFFPDSKMARRTHTKRNTSPRTRRRR